MPRMPMNGVAATSLLLLLMLFTSMPAQIYGRAARTTAVTESLPAEEETTYAGKIESNTVTIEVDSDVILTTEDGMQMFTHMPENGLTTTEEPLPDSVMQQLERERAERNPTTETTTTTTEVANLLEKLLAKNATTTTTTAATPTTTPATVITTDPTAEVFDKNMNFMQRSEDFVMAEDNLEAYIETTTFVPDMATPLNNLAAHFDMEKIASIAEEPEWRVNEESTYIPPQEVDSNTSGPIPFDAVSGGTDSMRMVDTTWMPDMAELIESTTETNMENFMTTNPPEPGSALAATRATESHNRATQKPLMDLLSMLSSNMVTEMVRMEPEAEVSTTEEPKLELTTDSAPPVSNTTEEVKLEFTTVNAPQESSTTEEVKLEFTTVSAPQESSTTAEPKLEFTTVNAPQESSTTEEVKLEFTTVSAPQESSTTAEPKLELTTDSAPPESSTTEETKLQFTTSNAPPESSTTEAVPETTVAPPKQQSMLTAILMIPTTIAPDTTTTTLATTSTTISTTTTEEIPTKKPTRAPRIERIFNSDGVEVLYGYSSVVRTNQS